MERRGYRVVGDLGPEAARVWAAHLGVVDRNAQGNQFSERAEIDS
jgi:hypothetical protein